MRTPILIATHLGAASLGWLSADTRPLDTEVKHEGYFQTDTTSILSATVESLREENRLLVYSYKGSADVQAQRSKWWILGARQRLSVPAVVSYYLDLRDLTLEDVRFDKDAKLVRVALPRLSVGDIAFQPERATTINGGLLTWDDEQVEALRKLNYASARKAMVAQSQQAGLLRAAQRSAIANIQSYFEIPLRIAGQPDVKVVASFR